MMGLLPGLFRTRILERFGAAVLACELCQGGRPGNTAFPTSRAFIVVTLLLLRAGSAFGAATLGDSLALRLGRAGPEEYVPVIIDFDTAGNAHAPMDLSGVPSNGELVKGLRSRASASRYYIDLLARQNGVRDARWLWITNSIAAEVKASLIERVRSTVETACLRLDRQIELPFLSLHSYRGATKPDVDPIEIVRAAKLWNVGIRGHGVVVACVDSGVELSHPDLKEKWRGGDNSWFDPYGKHDRPIDRIGHGTQMLGIILGGRIGHAPVGVAPDAKWIAARIYDDNGRVSISAIHAVYQWLLDPDNDPDTNDAPNIVNNSWGHVRYPGLCIPEFRKDLEILKKAGISIVFAAGNKGPSPSTSISPANLPESIAVGVWARDPNDILARLSSRGPSACGGGIYPDLSAPGGGKILTCDTSRYGDPPGYVTTGGSSAAASYVSGAMALLFSAFPAKTVSEVEDALIVSARDMGTPGPDNVYGHGLLDIWGAYTHLLNATRGGCDPEGLSH